MQCQKRSVFFYLYVRRSLKMCFLEFYVCIIEHSYSITNRNHLSSLHTHCACSNTNKNANGHTLTYAYTHTHTHVKKPTYNQTHSHRHTHIKTNASIIYVPFSDEGRKHGEVHKENWKWNLILRSACETIIHEQFFENRFVIMYLCIRCVVYNPTPI